MSGRPAADAPSRDSPAPPLQIGELPDACRAAAAGILTMPRPDGSSDESLWHRATRIARLALRIAALPDLSVARCDRRALAAAALFHDAAWADDVRSGRIGRSEVLLAPLDLRQRELSIDLLLKGLARQLPESTLATAARAIREAARRDTTAPEAIALSEACELDAVGPLWLNAELRRLDRRAGSLAELVEAWAEQERYGYWEARIREWLRFEPCRRVARGRLRGLAAFLETLAAQLREEDLETLIPR